MKIKITLLLVLALSLNALAQSPEALAKYHFIEAQNAYGNGDNNTALTNLQSCVEALTKTNSKIEALYTYIYLSKKEYLKAKKHMTSYFDIASEDHSDYMKMISLLTANKGKFEEAEQEKVIELKRQADMGITDFSNYDEIASFGSDNDWVNKLQSSRNNTSFINNELEKAKKYKSAQGKARLAFFYLEGIGIVESDNWKDKYLTAQNLCLEGVKIKNPLACYIYARTKYGWDSGEEAYFNLLKIADGKLDIATNALGYMYLSEYTDEGTPYNPTLGLKYYKEGYEKLKVSNKEVAAKIASSIASAYTYNETITRDKTLQLEWLKKSYNTFPNERAAYDIASFYLYNYKNPNYKVSASEIGRWYQRSADLGYATAMNDVANAYVKGYFGYPMDKNNAIKWYKKAADKGNKSAIKSLKELGLNYIPSK